MKDVGYDTDEIDGIIFGRYTYISKFHKKPSRCIGGEGVGLSIYVYHQFIHKTLPL